MSSETNHNEPTQVVNQPITNSANGDSSKRKDNKKQKKSEKCKFIKIPFRDDDSITDTNQDNSSGSGNNKPSSNNCDTSKKSHTPHIEGVVNTSSTSMLSSSLEKHQAKAEKSSKQSVRRTGGVYQFIEEKQKISLSKERRAARTLGIIMVCMINKMIFVLIKNIFRIIIMFTSGM